MRTNSFKTIIITGPSAIGKSYLAELIMDRYPNLFENAKLYTTRKARGRQKSTDRIHVSEKEFDELIDKGVFVIHGAFAGNRYGYPVQSLHPENKHILVNAWPSLVQDFQKMEHAILVGMQAPISWSDFLTSRMHRRGDDDQTISTRLEFIRRDIADLHDALEVVNNNGKVFVINDDDTIPKKVLPWLEERLGLQT